jgi:hypothetical protein
MLSAQHLNRARLTPILSRLLNLGHNAIMQLCAGDQTPVHMLCDLKAGSVIKQRLTLPQMRDDHACRYDWMRRVQWESRTAGTNQVAACVSK